LEFKSKLEKWLDSHINILEAWKQSDTIAKSKYEWLKEVREVLEK